jgi:AAA family ATP:ADP antiporter
LTIRALFPRIEPDERMKLIYAVAAFMCVAAVGVIARTAGSTLFLSQFSADKLAPMYVASALILMGVSFGFGWLVSQVPLVRLIPAVAVLLVVVTLVLRAAAATSWVGSSVAVYLFSDIVAKLPALMFWSFAAMMFDPRQAKRLFVLVGTGGTLACVVSGALIKPLVGVFGTVNLLLPVALLLVVYGTVIRRWVLTQETVEAVTKPRGNRPSPGMRYYGELIRMPQVRTLTTVVVVSTVSLVLTDFLFKSSARAHYVAADLAVFFGQFYSLSSLTALLVQLFLVHTIMRRGGVLVVALIFPASILIMSTGVALTGGFGWVIAAKFVDPVFDFTVNAAAMQLLYLGIRKQSRSQARAFIEGIMRPTATVLGGLFLIRAAATIPPRAIAAVIAVGAIVWLLAAWRSCRAYVAGLIDSIGAHQFDPRQEAFTLDDKVVETHLRQMLRTATDEEVLYLIEILPHMDQKALRAEYRELLARELPEIKVAALEYLRDQGEAEDVVGVRAALGHQSPAVRQAAIHAIASLLRAGATKEIEPLIADPDAKVRAAATTELLNNGDLEGLLAACISLKDMLRADDEGSRAAAAHALAGVDHQGLTQVLGELLGDPDQSVRRAALTACAERPDPALIPSVLPVLSDPDLGIVAADTLAVFGAHVLPHFASFPDDAREHPREELLLVPVVLAQTKDPGALPLLAKALDTPNIRLRTRVAEAYCELVATLPPVKRPVVILRLAALREIGLSEERARTIEHLKPYDSARLLSAVLEEERLDLLGNAFRFIGTLHPQVNTRSILWVLRSGSAERRAAALEVLDNVLDAELKGALLSVFEPTPGDGDGVAGEEPVADLLTDGHSEFVVASAAYASGRQGVVSTLDSIRALLGNDSPYVREAALDAFSRLAPRDEVVATASSMINDPSAGVATLASQLTAARG